MKFSISVSDFQYAMRLVRDVVPNSGPTSETTGILISAQEGKAIFSASNPEVSAEATVKVSLERGGEVVVDAAALYGAISHFQPINDKGVGTSDILVSSSPKAKKLTISASTHYPSGNETTHRRVLSLKNQEFFPSIPSPFSLGGRASDSCTLELPASILMDAIDGVVHAISSDKNQFVFTGTLLRLQENELVLFATNGKTLAEYRAPVPYTGQPVSVVLPGALASKISKSFFDNDTLLVTITNSMMFIRTPNLVLGGALIREEYPDYTAFIPKAGVSAVVNKYIFLDNLASLSYEASSFEDNRVTMRFSNGGAFLICGDSENGGIPATAGEDFEFSCDLKLLAAATRNIVGDELVIGYVGAERPLLFSSEARSPSGSKLISVVAPLASPR